MWVRCWWMRILAGPDYVLFFDPSGQLFWVVESLGAHRYADISVVSSAPVVISYV